MYALNQSDKEKTGEISGYGYSLFNPLGGSQDSVFDPQSGPIDGLLVAQANEAGESSAAVDQAEAEASAAAIAEAMMNPLSYLWLLFAQNDLISYDGTAMDAIGEGAQLQNTTLLMPVPLRASDRVSP